MSIDPETTIYCFRLPCQSSFVIALPGLHPGRSGYVPLLTMFLHAESLLMIQPFRMRSMTRNSFLTFLAKKREIFLVQIGLDTLKSEIDKLRVGQRAYQSRILAPACNSQHAQCTNAGCRSALNRERLR